MATVNPVYVGDIVGDGSTQMFTWALTTANSDGAPLEWASFSDRTFMAVGTWGGATMTVEGSNDGSNWVPLSDAAGATDATAAANKAITVVELTRYVRPNLTTPGTGAVVTASIVMRRATPLRT